MMREYRKGNEEMGEWDGGIPDRENIERLEITGVGGPSGRGLGFSYVRVTPKAPVSNSSHKKSAAAKGTTVTGTDADLRRLSMDAAREIIRIQGHAYLGDGPADDQ
ncbi:transcription initiation factor TFIID subunit 1 [Hordeum vulgare]|nr:transcription initiation factor TFIID subunit 1 [Hordeum vulgare]